jgi:hypothetical protein
MAALFENRARPLAMAGAVAKARIKEACIMHAELTHQRIEGHHLGGMSGRDAHGFARGQDEFCQFLDYIDDIDIKKKLIEWEQLYNFSRPHGAFNGKTPYKFLREKQSNLCYKLRCITLSPVTPI